MRAEPAPTLSSRQATTSVAPAGARVVRTGGRPDVNGGGPGCAQAGGIGGRLEATPDRGSGQRHTLNVNYSWRVLATDRRPAVEGDDRTDDDEQERRARE